MIKLKLRLAGPDPPPAASPQSAHAAAAGGRQLLHLVPAVGVVQKGHVLVVAGPAAGRVVPQLPGQHPPVHQVGQGQVVVGGDAGARPAAVLEQDRLVGVVAQTQVSDLQQDGPQAAGGVRSGPPGPAQDGWTAGCPVPQRGCFWFLTWNKPKSSESTLEKLFF